MSAFVEALAAVAAALLDAERQAVLASATIAEVGEGGTLPEAIAEMITSATPAQLAKLKPMYEQRAAAKFTSRCNKCNSTDIANRSSVEAVPREAGAPQKKSIGRLRLH